EPRRLFSAVPKSLFWSGRKIRPFHSLIRRRFTPARQRSWRFRQNDVDGTCRSNSMDAATLRQTLALASAFKEGDRSIVGVVDDRVREEARRVLLATAVGDIHATVLIDDRVSEQLQRSRDRRFDAEFRFLTIGRVREALLDPGADAWVLEYGPALGSETIAAV